MFRSLARVASVALLRIALGIPLGIALAVTAGSAGAQTGNGVHPNSLCPPTNPDCNGDTRPPSVSISPGPETVGGALVTITITWGDDRYLDGGTRWIALNGTQLNAHFTYVATDTAHATSTGTVTLAHGANTFTASIKDKAGNLGADTVHDTYTPATVAVTPDGDSVSVADSSAQTVAFTVKNTGTYSATYSVWVACTGAVTGCSAHSPVTLTGGAQTTDTVHLQSGAPDSTGRVTLHANIAGDTTVADTGWVTAVMVQPYPVAVTPDGDTVHVAASHAATQRFAIYNPAPTSTQYTITASCRWNGSTISCSGVPGSPITVPPGQTAYVDVTYTAGASGTGRIALTATQTSPITVADSGWAIATMGSLTAGAPTVAVDSVNPGPRSERDLCLNLSRGPGTAIECGDLRVVHALPTVRTLNTARTPVLLYASETAIPQTVIAANVTLGATRLPPESIKARLILSGGRTVDSATWSGAAWQPGTTRRIALALRDTTAVLVPYTVQVTAIYNGGSTYSDSASGEAVLVNRQTSPFGAGWWLAGLERLVIQNSDTLVWIDGDASARVYARTALGSSVFKAPALTRPDSIVQLDTLGGTHYVRYLPNGLRVLFNSVGQHVLTINRLGHQTTFTYATGGDTLTAIGVPHWGDSTTYAFAYSSGRLQSVTVAVSGGTNRVTTLTSNRGRITAIEDPDSAIVTFAYPTVGDTNLIVARSDSGMPTVTHTFAFSGARKVVSDSVAPDSGEAPIVARFHVAEARGLHGGPDSAAAPTDSVYTNIDGPRPVADVTRIWVDRYGEPTRVLDALGDSTLVARTDTAFPALVTWERLPNGRAIAATYDSKGHLTSSTDSGTVQVDTSGDTTYAVTQYKWNPKWDMVDTTISPLGETSAFQHDSVTGNLVWQDDPRGSLSRVHYWYDATTELLDSMRTPMTTHATRYAYDASLANLTSATTPMGFVTTYVRDSVGRIVDTKAPTQDTLVTHHVVQYDLSDRVLTTTDAGPALNGAPAESVFVHNYYDRAGALDSLVQWVVPNRNGINHLRTWWKRDAAGRTVAQVQPDGPADHYRYDEAGDRTTWTTRNGDVIRSSYDLAGRVIQRVVPGKTDTAVVFDGVLTPLPFYYGNDYVIPADTQVFAYDAAGDVVRADNRDAQVHRTYTPFGAVATDTLRIRTWSGTDFSKHVYGLGYTYDLDGRRKTLVQPAQLVVNPYDNFLPPNNSYSYTPTGQLARISDEFGHLTYAYDSADRVDSIGWGAAGVYETRRYDEDGRLIARLQRNPLAPAGTDTIHHESFAYDARGRRTTVVTSQDSTDLGYSGLGNLVRSNRADCGRTNGTCIYGLNNPLINERWATDALGRQDTVETNAFGYDIPGTYTYDAASGRHRRSTAPQYGTPSDTVAYDAAGSVTHEAQWAMYPTINTECGTWPVAVTKWTGNYYTADGHLALADVESNGNRACFASQAWGTFEETRYDALGRRVLVRSRRDTTLIYGSITRFVWDGSQVLWEIHYPGDNGVIGDSLEIDTATFAQACDCGCSHPPECGEDPDSLPKGYSPMWGRVLYLNGPDIDQPVLIARYGYGQDTVPFDSTLRVYPMYNWRGLPDDGSLFENWQQTFTYHGETATILWPAHNTLAYHRVVLNSEPPSWFGSLMSLQATDAGTQYMRNRYYDPIAGRFTQEDPIGLVGGLNTYGYADGDPITYSDPIGLCPPCGIDLAAPLEAVQAAVDQDTRRQRLMFWLPVLAHMMDVGPAGNQGDGNSDISESAEATEAGEAFDLLMPGGKPIGTPGSSPDIREVSGGFDQAKTLFDGLTKGAEPYTPKKDYRGIMRRLPSGGTVGLRTGMTRSPGTTATIDVNIKGLDISKIKFKP